MTYSKQGIRCFCGDAASSSTETPTRGSKLLTELWTGLFIINKSNYLLGLETQ